jgi:hypothetical protein
VEVQKWQEISQGTTILNYKENTNIINVICE